MKDTYIVLIISTPFHAIQFSKVLELKQYKEIDNLSIFHTEIVSSTYLSKVFEKYNVRSIEKIAEGDISTSGLLKNPFNTIINNRKILTRYKYQIGCFLDGISNKFILMSGSDKSKFDQIFYSFARNNIFLNKIILVDEGTALYIKKSKKEFFINIIYVMFSKILFGVRLRYYIVMGQDSRIDIIYARRLDLIQNKIKDIEYIGLTTSFKVNIDRVNKSDKILLISSPYSEDNMLSIKYEHELLLSVLNYCVHTNMFIYIKPHPREDISKFDFIKKHKNTSIIDNSIPSENMEYNDYKVIINFGSSAVLDIVLNGYPHNNIITVLPKRMNSFTPFLEGLKLNVITYESRAYNKEFQDSIRKLL